MQARRVGWLRSWAIAAISSLSVVPHASAQGIAAAHPGDVGIKSDPRVYFAENFERASASELSSAWPDAKNPSYTTLVTDVPAASAGAKSLLLDGSKGSTHWYRNLSAGGTVYVRYYVKRERGKHFHHDGIWIGGYNPPTTWPQGTAGRRVPPDDFFSVGFEGLDGVQSVSGDAMTLGFYNYWMGMHPDGTGTYWGENQFVGPGGRITTNEWHCVEYMIKLNDPVTRRNGELAVWVDGQQLIHFGEGFPKGIQTNGIWKPDANGTPYPGFQWRDDPGLGLNWVWLLNDPPGEYPGSPSGKIWVDDLVIASEYIGPIAKATSPTAPSPPAAPYMLP